MSTVLTQAYAIAAGTGITTAIMAHAPAVHAEMNAMLSASRSEMIGATLYLAGVDLETGKRIPPDEISPCPVCMRMIRNAGVDVVTSA